MQEPGPTCHLFTVLAFSWAVLGEAWEATFVAIYGTCALLGCLGRLLAVLDVSRAVLGSSWEGLGVLDALRRASPSPWTWTPSAWSARGARHWHGFVTRKYRWSSGA